MSKIENFWNWFLDNHEKYSNFNEIFTSSPEEASVLLENITTKLQTVSEGLFLEIFASEEKKELTITAQGNKEYFADVFSVVNQSPILESWSFIATKPAVSNFFNFKMADTFINSDEILFMPLEAKEYPDDIAIRLYHKDYTAEEGAVRNAVIVGLYAGLNMLLGEVSTTLDLQYIDFDDIPHPKEETFPLRELPEYIKYKKEKRLNHAFEFPKENITLMEGKIEELPMLLVLNKSLKHYSFSKNFPYLLQMTLTLKNIGENGLPNTNTDELYLIEDIIYQEIYKKEQGHFVATETYNGKRDIFYYANSKKLVENALSMLPLEYDSCDVHYSLDYDPFWIRINRFMEL